MFVRLKSSKKSKHETVQIVRSVRTPQNKVKQEIVALLGVIRNDSDRAALVKLAKSDQLLHPARAGSILEPAIHEFSS